MVVPLSTGSTTRLTSAQFRLKRPVLASSPSVCRPTGSDTVCVTVVQLCQPPVNGTLPSPLRARVVNVFTEDAWRRKGIAQHLMQACMADCRSRGVARFNLAASTEGERLYRALGFKPYGHEMSL